MITLWHARRQGWQASGACGQAPDPVDQECGNLPNVQALFDYDSAVKAMAMSAFTDAPSNVDIFVIV